MKSFTICALLAAGVSAVPFVAQKHAAMHHNHEKRDIVWVTETDIDTVTIPVTKTVWVDGSATTKEAAFHSKSHYSSSESSSATSASSSSFSSVSSSSEYSAPAYSSETTSSSSSVYVAPTSTSESSSSSSSTSTSVYVAPTTSYVAATTSSTSSPEYVAPTTTSSSVATSTYEASTTSSSAAAATSGAVSASYTGDLTYYDTGLGSCGWENTDSDMIVALAVDMMDKNTYCGAIIEIVQGTASHTATIVDTCMGCTGGALDLSPSLFTVFAPTASGRLHSASWSVLTYPTAVPTYGS